MQATSIETAGLADAAARAAAFARDWSLEATRPSAAEIGALRAILRPGAALYLSSVPTQSPEALLAAVREVAAAGFEPVPHIAARRYSEAGDLERLLAGLREDGGVRRILLIGGDCDHPAGPFASALDVIASRLLTRCGIEEIGIAGYPDGHPRLPSETLTQVLAAKVEAARAAGLRLHIVSQFTFEPQRILAWLQRLRERGIAVPVQVGLVGPTSIPTLLRYAKRCGVAASARGLMRAGLAKALFGDTRPDAILRALLSAPPEIGDIAPHYFSFGGIVRTASYGREAADKRFALD